MMRRDHRLAVGFLMCVAGVVSAHAADGAEWTSIAAPLRLEFPRDHGAHPDFRTEWWYATGIVRDAGGRTFGYQATIFRHGLFQRPREERDRALWADQILAGHLAIADIGENKFLFAERLRRDDGGMAGYLADDMRVWVENWEMRREAGDSIRIRLEDREKGIGVDLTLSPQKPPVLHGENGLSRKGPDAGNASAYVSWTRLETTGELLLNGQRFDANGHSWFDHEWGTSQMAEGLAGWDWFGLRLDDGRELMLYRLRRTDGSAAPESGGTLVDARGGATILRAEDYSLEAIETWKSPDSGAEYPIRWLIRVPGADLEIESKALVPGAELRTERSTGVVYWEGPLSVSGSATGEGYCEMTGYAGSPGLKF